MSAALPNNQQAIEPDRAMRRRGNREARTPSPRRIPRNIVRLALALNPCRRQRFPGIELALSTAIKDKPTDPPSRGGGAVACPGGIPDWRFSNHESRITN